MKVLSLTPFNNNWQGYYKKFFEARGHEFRAVKAWDVKDLEWADVAICNWSDELAIQLTRQEKKYCKYIVVLRSYEIFCIDQMQIDWDKVDHLIFVNDYIKQTFEVNFPYCKTRKSVIYNAIDLDEWEKQDHAKGSKIALVANINHKKGIQMLPHILAALPQEYTLHIAGAMQEPRFFAYLTYMSKALGLWNTRIFYEGEQEDIQGWLKDKDYVLLASPVEGNPNCIIEALALGIKPVVHNFPGSQGQFHEESMFNTIEEAVKIITSKDYYSKDYREYAEQNYNFMEQYLKIEGVMS